MRARRVRDARLARRPGLEHVSARENDALAAEATPPYWLAIGVVDEEGGRLILQRLLSSEAVGRLRDS